MGINVKENRKELLDKMSELISKGKLNWERGWNVATLSPKNPVSGYIYKGGNRIRLMINSIDKGYDDPRYMTYVQAQKKGWQVRRGEKGVLCEKYIYTKEVTVEDPLTGIKKKELELLEHPYINFFYVYNAAQIEGIPALTSPQKNEDTAYLDVIENLIKASPCVVKEERQPDAYYSPANDVIVLPLREDFKSNSDFLKTLAHEQCHSTGHPDRLNRNLSGIFGTPEYAREELRAELGSLFLLSDIGVPADGRAQENHAAYLGSWLEALKNDPDELFKAAGDAEKGADFIKKRYELVISGESFDLSDIEEITGKEEKVSQGIEL